MRVTLVSPFDPYSRGTAPSRGHAGGVERVYAEVASHLARRGHEVTLVCSTAGPPDGSDEGGVRVVRARRRATVLRAPLVRLGRHISSQTDIVHVPAIYPFTTSHILQRAKRLGIPSILDFHFEPAPGTPLGRVAAALYSRVGPRSFPLAAAVLVRSIAYARASPSLSPVPSERWRIVPNGVDTTRFRPDGARARSDYLLFVGRLVPYKGVDVLLHALGRIRPAPPLVIAGDGPERRRLELLARRLNLDAWFLGHVEDKALPGLYRDARLTVLPSVTRQEAFGLTLLESMACGTPVVASGLPGVEEIARLGGRVARPGDAESLANELRQSLASPSALPGTALAARIHEAYSWEAVTDRLEAVYGEVLGRPDGPLSSSGIEVKSHADPRGHPVL